MFDERRQFSTCLRSSCDRPSRCGGFSSSGERGVALFMVLVLMAVVGLFGVGALKSGIGQLQIVNVSVLFDRREQAVEAAMECVISEFILQGAGSVGEQIIALDPNIRVTPGKITTGCSRKVTAAGPQYIEFNETPVTLLNQFCGRELPPPGEGSDLELFSVEKYLLSAAHYDSTGRRKTAALHQAWSIEQPVDLSSLNSVAVESGGEFLSYQEACQNQLVLFAD